MQKINPMALKNKMESGPLLLIDVREPIEHKAESIDGAVLLPLSMISCDKLPTEAGTIVVHCKSGKRSEAACARLLQQNAALDIYTLEGGIDAWKASGYSVKRTSGVLPIERQTHILAGLLVILGVMAGTIISQKFYILSGFVGLGLLVSGVTGWCGSALLLAKMPWNK